MHKNINKINKSLTIKQWKEDDRPREKMLLKGKSSLTDAELLAIVIGSGTREESALALSKRILLHCDNNLNALAKLSATELIQFKGIGIAKAVSIVTALEMGRRRKVELAQEKQKVNSSKDVFDIMHVILGDLSHEEFWILFLNNANKILDKTQLSIGGITATLVDVRQVHDDPEIMAALRKRVPAYMVPHKLVEAKSLPQTPNGKVDRKAAFPLVFEP